jgi:hypothetical protein
VRGVAARVSVRRDPLRAGYQQIELVVPGPDGRPSVRVYHVPPGDSPVAYCEWLVNTSLVQRLSNHYVLFHAGAVAYAQTGILLPAAHGHGKSTLVAALAACGFSFFGDDIAPVDPVDLALLPYPKSACVKWGSRDALSRWYPQLDRDAPRARFGDQRVWYLTPPPASWPAAPAPIRHVVLPRFVPGACSALESISRMEALARLREHTFSPAGSGAAVLACTVALLRQAECHALTVGTLDRAAALLVELVTRSSAPG